MLYVRQTSMISLQTAVNAAVNLHLVIVRVVPNAQSPAHLIDLNIYRDIIIITLSKKCLNLISPLTAATKIDGFASR